MSWSLFLTDVDATWDSLERLRSSFQRKAESCDGGCIDGVRNSGDGASLLATPHLLVESLPGARLEGRQLVYLGLHLVLELLVELLLLALVDGLEHPPHVLGVVVLRTSERCVL